MFEYLEKYFTKIKSIAEENNVSTSEEMNKLFFNEDGTFREEVFGDIMEEMRKEVESRVPKKATEYVPVDIGDLDQYDDDALYEMLLDVLYDDGTLSGKKKIAHIAYEFDMEYANGGASQFFANTRGEHIDELADAFTSIGALEYARVCDEFIKKYDMKTADFKDDNDEDYWDRVENLYPYEELEKAIDKLCRDDSLQYYIISYVRKNSESFK